MRSRHAEHKYWDYNALSTAAHAMVWHKMIISPPASTSRYDGTHIAHGVHPLASLAARARSSSPTELTTDVAARCHRLMDIHCLLTRRPAGNPPPARRHRAEDVERAR